MAYLKDLTPELRDEVKHKEQTDYSGVVIAKYTFNSAVLLDVRVEENLICYASPIANWEVTKLNDEAD